MGDVHDTQAIRIEGPAPAAETLEPSARTQVVDGVRVELTGDAVVGEASELTFAFTDARTGRPVDDLRPYLAAAGHVVVMREDAATFAHEHADVEDEDGNPVFALPGQEFGPELDVHAEFETPGLYRLWGQFRLADGSVLTVPFTVRAD
jgi:Cu+-exporting ATPase